MVNFKTISGNRIHLFDFQKEMINKCQNQNTILLSSGTGTGKSLVAYDYMGILNNTYKNYDKIIYTSPIKSLSMEKYKEFCNNKINCGILTGDIKYIPYDSNVIFMTQEIFNNNYSMDIKNSIVVIDEIHYIFNNHDRARSYVESLAKIDPSNKILLMSATIGNIQEFAEYLEKITYGRKIHIIENDKRLVPLSFSKKGIKTKNIKDAIVFAFSRKDIINIIDTIVNERQPLNEYIIKDMSSIIEDYKCNFYDEWKYGITRYHGRMLPKEKLCIDKLYRSGYIDTIVGTDALALGVNLAVSTAIFATMKKGDGEQLKPSEFFQLSGRAGRYGFNKKGIVTYLRDGFVEDPIELKEEFIKLSESSLEKSNISIYPDHFELLNGKDMDHEIDDMIRFKFPFIEKNRENIKKYKSIIQSELDIYNEFGKEIQKIEGDKFFDYWDKILKIVYLPEFTIEQNCDLCYFYCKNIFRKGFLDFKTLADYYTENIDDIGELLYEYLLLRKYYKKYENCGYNAFIGFSDFENIIREIDHTVLDV